MSLVLRLPREIHRCRSSSNVPCLPSYDGNATKPSRFAHFWKGAQSLAPATRKHIWTSKSAPYPTVFCAFHFEMCFAPQRRTLFRHINFQKCSEPVSFIQFWLRNVLRATTAYTFSTSQLPKVLWTHQFFTLLTSKCASRHNGVHFFDISTSKSALNPSVFYTFDFQMCFAPQWRTLFRHLNFQKCSEPVNFFTRLTSKCASRQNGMHFFGISTSKSALNPSVLQASCHNGVHFFDISTSKSDLNPPVFCTFDFQMCFALQRRALFRHLNFQKCSEPVSFLHFWLRNVLCTTMSCTFSTSQFPKVVRTCGAFNILTSKCASRHNGVQFFISHLPSGLCTCRFSEPTFQPSGATNHWKNTVFRDFPTFSGT